MKNSFSIYITLLGVLIIVASIIGAIMIGSQAPDYQQYQSNLLRNIVIYQGIFSGVSGVILGIFMLAAAKIIDFLDKINEALNNKKEKEKS